MRQMSEPRTVILFVIRAVRCGVWYSVRCKGVLVGMWYVGELVSWVGVGYAKQSALRNRKQ